MSKTFNPALSKELNRLREKFNIAVVAPFLPPAGEEYATHLFYLTEDACFYRCVLCENAWVWEKVTYGIHRQYVLSVAFVQQSKIEISYSEVDKTETPVPEEGVKYYTKSGDDYAEAVGLTAWQEGVTYYVISGKISLYVFDDIVDAINDIIVGLKHYGVTEFTELENVTMVEAVEAINALIKHVNYICNEELEYVPANWEDEDEQVEMENIVNYLNPLIGAVNPHARDRAAIDDALKNIAEVAERMASADVEVIAESLNARMDQLAATHNQDKTTLSGNIDTLSGQVSSLATTVANKADATAVQSLAGDVSTLQGQMSNKADGNTVQSLAGAVSTLQSTVGGLENTVSGLSSQVSANTAAASTAAGKADAAKSAADANAVDITKLKALATALANLTTSNDMSVNDVAVAIRAIKAAAVAATTVAANE